MKGLLFICILTIISVGHTQAAGVVGCYYGSWAVYNDGHGKCGVEDIDASHCTHLYYAFAGLNEGTHSIESLDAWNDLPEDGGMGNYIKINDLKNSHPGLKVILSIGGWTEGSEKYSDMVNNDGWRNHFVDTVEAFLEKYNFDGLDFDWEYPTQRGGVESDRQAFVTLLSELKSRFQSHGWLLTGAFGASSDLLWSAYDVKAIAQHLDYFNLMTYDYHGNWDDVTGANSPLYGDPSIEQTIEDWLNAGAPANKIVLGIPFYGLAFILKDPNNAKMGAPAESSSFSGPWGGEGQIGYNEICYFLNQGGWTHHYDEESHSPYITNGNKFIAYDDEDSIKEKVAYALSKGFAGAMTWSVDTDDIYNDCNKGSHPLLKALYAAANGN